MNDFAPSGRGRILALILALGMPIAAWSCSVPVFRYALEHWAPDTFEALIFHRGELTPAQDALRVRLAGDGQGIAPNLSVRTVDVDDPTAAEWLPVWKQLKGDTLPWLTVRPAPKTGMPWLLTSQPLTAKAVDGLADSPARSEIAKRLAGGQSAVWVLLDSGNAEADAAAEQRLTERLEYLRSVLKLPELDEADIANGLISLGGADLRLEFSILKLSRSDPAERQFTTMLLKTEDDLIDLKEPMVFPIFGRGRALYTLVGKGINNETIDQAAIFLTGSCSCEVKDQNPGVDLLMTADWMSGLRTTDTNAPTEPNPDESTPPVGQPVTVTFGTDEPPASDPAPDGGKKVTGGFLLVFLAAGFVVFLFTRR
jgi:hypothetical protein